MASHNVNVLLKYGLPVLLVFLVTVSVISKFHHAEPQSTESKQTKNSASADSAAESLDTLTASLVDTKKQIEQITQDNEKLKSQNQNLIQKIQSTENSSNQNINQEVESLKKQILEFQNKDDKNDVQKFNNSSKSEDKIQDQITHFYHGIDFKKNETGFSQKPKLIPYYTIPANATAVDDKLMTALVGRIPVKGVVTDPYPFKIVFSDDTLAASGWRVPHLRQMIVSGFTEGDLNLLSVRGWVTSLSFIFDDGRVFNTTSNNNDIGHFSKDNALGYLSDEHGNPFFQGKLITNAPSYLTGNVLLDGAQGAANAFAQAQTTNQSSPFGSTTSSVTGSPSKYILGQAGVNAANGVQQWWHDREENSFDAIYVPSGEKIVVNFAKEIDIDYDPIGRKIEYGHQTDSNIQTHLD